MPTRTANTSPTANGPLRNQDWGQDQKLLFAGLNVLPKCTAMSTYADSLDDIHLLRLQQSFVQ